MKRYFTCVFTTVFALLTTLPLLIIVWLSFSNTTSGSSESALIGVYHYNTILRSYLFRHAVQNTLWVTLLSQVVSLAFALIFVRPLVRHSKIGILLSLLLLLSLTIPPIPEAMGWHRLFDELHLLNTTEGALLATIWVYIRHTVPIATFVLFAAVSFERRSITYTNPARNPETRWSLLFGRLFQQYQRFPQLTVPALFTFLICIYLTATDIGIILVLTGGEPFNASHLWSSWIYQTGIVSGDLRQSAAMAATMLPLLFALVGSIIWLGNLLIDGQADQVDRRKSQDTRGCNSCPPDRSLFRDFRGAFFITPLCILLWIGMILLPLIGIFLNLIDSPNTIQTLELSKLLIQTHYIDWWFNTIGVGTGVALLSAMIVLCIEWGFNEVSILWKRRLSNSLLFIALVTWPLLFIPLSWFSSLNYAVDPRVFLVLVYSIILVPMVLWLRLRVGIAKNFMEFVGILITMSLSLSIQDFTNPWALNMESAQQPITVGIVANFMYRLEISGVVLLVAIVVPGIFLSLLYLSALLFSRFTARKI